jgi:MoxR-like ATPase
MRSMSEAAIANAPTQDIVKEADAAVQLLGQVRAEIGKVVFGQERVVELVLATILAGGHALLIGAPGLAKTKLVETTARALGLDWGRVQFTPDLMPSDILGSEILDESGKAPTRCPKRSWIASCSRSTSTIRTPKRNAASSSRPPAWATPSSAQSSTPKS